MKNLKRALSLVLSTVMLMGMMVVGTGASYADVDTADNLAAIEILEAVGVMEGDENGNFNPDAEIKRSEFAAVVCRALGQEAAATSTVSKFPDVSSDHWAVGYIGWAAGKAIVNGYEDGTFRPRRSLTRAELATIVWRIRQLY